MDDVRTENRRDDGCDDLKDLFYSIPFNHNVIFLKVRHIFAGQALLDILTFSGDRESSKETSTLPKAPPYMEGMQHVNSCVPAVASGKAERAARRRFYSALVSRDDAMNCLSATALSMRNLYAPAEKNHGEPRRGTGLRAIPRS